MHPSPVLLASRASLSTGLLGVAVFDQRFRGSVLLFSTSVHTEDCDEDLQASNAFAYEHPDEVIRNLTQGSGEWVFQIDAGTRVSKITDGELQAIVDDLLRSGITRHDMFDALAPHRSEALGNLGAHSVFKLGESSDRAQLVFSSGSIGSFLRTDPESAGRLCSRRALPALDQSQSGAPRDASGRTHFMVGDRGQYRVAALRVPEDHRRSKFPCTAD